MIEPSDLGQDEAGNLLPIGRRLLSVHGIVVLGVVVIEDRIGTLRGFRIDLLHLFVLIVLLLVGREFGQLLDQRREQGGLEGIDPQQRSDEGRRIEGLDRPAISQDGHSGLTQRSKVIGPWCAGSGGTIPIANILLILGSTSSTAAATDLLARTSGRSRHDPVRWQEHPLEQRVLAGGPGTVTTIITTVLIVSAARRSRRNHLLQTFQHPLVVGVDAVPIHLAEEGMDRGPKAEGVTVVSRGQPKERAVPSVAAETTTLESSGRSVAPHSARTSAMPQSFCWMAAAAAAAESPVLRFLRDCSIMRFYCS